MPKLDEQQSAWVFARLCARFGPADALRADAEYFLRHEPTKTVISVRFGTMGMSYGAPLIEPRKLEPPPGFARATADLEAELRAMVPTSCAVTYWDELDGVVRAGSRAGRLFSDKPPLLEAIRWLDATRDAKRFVDRGLHEWYVLLEWLEAGHPGDIPAALRSRLVFEVERSIGFAVQHQTSVDAEWCNRMRQSVEALDLPPAQATKLAQVCRGH